MSSAAASKRAYCYLVSNEGRDFHLLVPIIYYLEKYENFEVSFEFVWDAHKIRLNPPDLVIVPNTRGQLLYYEIALYAKESGIPVYQNDSEGNFPDMEDYDFWGFNRTKSILSPVLFTWNTRVKGFLERKYGIDPEMIKVSGAPNFDKYQYSSVQPREAILSKYGKESFTKVIGYAGWAFGKLYNKEFSDILSLLEMEETEGRSWFEDQRDKTENQLRAAIEAFPDVLFILKKHPRENFESDYRDSRNEMNRLDYPNVLYLKDQEEIHQLIQISDLWMAFESTSIFEAWLMEKPTIVLNEVSEFKRSDTYKGSIASKNPEELVNAIRELYAGNIALFNPEHLLEKRKTIVSEAIGFSDGKNHLRTALYYREFLPKAPLEIPKPKLHLRFLKLYILLHIGRFFYIPWLFRRLPKLKKTVWIFENYRLSAIKREKEQVFRDLDSFYEKNGLPEKIRSGKLWEELRQNA